MLRIPPIAATHSKLIANSVPGDSGHPADCLWPELTHVIVTCMACQFDRQVYGNQIDLT
jgi:hypothetical protein